MSEQDIAIGPVGVPNVGNFNKKPLHLIELTGGKSQQVKFLSLDKPESSLAGFIQVKGLFIESSDVSNNDYFSFVSSAKKDSLVEMYFPLHRVQSIKNLMFKAK